MLYSVLMTYVLGFDGGGTKTECVLMDSSDHVVARTFAGPSNPFRIGVEPAVLAVQEAAHLALREAQLDLSAIAAVGAGLAGTANPDLRERAHSALQTAFPGVPVTLLTDLEAALAAAGEGPVIVLVAGTGSAALGRNQRREINRAGGYGPSSSDHGSAFDVGRQVIAAATKAHTDTAAPSALEKEVLLLLGCTSWAELLRRAESAPDDVYPRIFPVIATAADAGDVAVREILLSAVAELSALAQEVANRLGLHQNSFRLAKTGGMFGRSSFFDAQFDATMTKLFPHAEIGGLRISPAEAAALAARC